MSRRPSPLEIQDALFGGALRIAAYATAAIALIVFGAPWEAGPGGTIWTWDIWSGSEVFFLLPVIAGILLGVAGAIEAVPGVALGLGALAAGLAWSLICADELAPAFAAWGGGVDDRATLARIAIPVLLAGLAFRRALHRSIVSRIVLGLGAVGTLCVFFVPMGGSMLFQRAVLDPLGTGEIVPGLAAAGPALTLLAAGGALATLLPSPRGTGGLSALALALFHVTAAAVAFAHVPPFVATLGDIDLSYGAFVMPLKMGGLLWTALVWTALGAGTAGAALEAKLRGEPLPSRRPVRSEPRPPGSPAGGRPVAIGQPIVLSGAPAAAAPAAAPAPLDLSSPLPPPPGFGGGALPDEVPPQLHSEESGDIVEISPKHALPLLDTLGAPAAAPAPAITPVPAKLPTPAPAAPPPRPPRASVPPASPASAARAIVPNPTPAPSPVLRAPTPATPVAPAPATAPAAAGAAPRAAFRARTQLGMPSVAPGVGRGPTPATVPRPEDSGRTGDTNLGLPVTRPKPPGAATPAAPAEGGEVSGLRFWPPPAGSDALPPTREAAATPAFGVEILKDVATMRQTPSVVPPTAGIKPARPAPAPAPTPAAVRLAESVRSPSSDTSEAVRHRISGLQRQLARGEITADQYQQRLGEILKSK